MRLFVLFCAVFIVNTALSFSETHAFSLSEELSYPKNLDELMVGAALCARIRLHLLPKILEHITKTEPTLVLERQNTALALFSGQFSCQVTEKKSQESIRATVTYSPYPAKTIQKIASSRDLLSLGRHLIAVSRDTLANLNHHWGGVRIYEYDQIREPRPRVETLAQRLHLVDLILGRIQPTSNWFVKANDLDALEKLSLELNNSDAWLLTLVAEAKLLNALVQQSITSASSALLMEPNLGRARFIRALAHWKMEQLGLAEHDLTVLVNASSEDDPSLCPILRARGALGLLLGKTAQMCADFHRACSLGDCEGLAHARKLSFCRESQTNKP